MVENMVTTNGQMSSSSGTTMSHIRRGTFQSQIRQIHDEHHGVITNAFDVEHLLTHQGAGAVAQDKAVGYYYGGWLTNRSVPGYNTRTPLSNMVIYNMLEAQFNNDTRPDDTPRAEGVMQYIPAGDAGLLVYFGGIQFPYNNETVEAVRSYPHIILDNH